MSTQLKRLNTFITSQLYKSPDDDQVNQFVLFHSKPGGVVGRQLDTYVPGVHYKPEEIAKGIMMNAQNDADVYPLVQHYVVMAYRESDPGSAVGSIPFKLRPKNQDGDASASEPPTKDGLTAQLMRHLETVQNNQAAWQQGVFQQVLKFVELQSTELARHRELSHDTHRAREQLMLERVSVQHQANLRDLELAGDEDETKKLIAETASKYLPMAMPVLMQGMAQLVSGQKPEGDAPQPALTPPAFDIAQMLQSMGDEQKQKLLTSIAQGLSPEELQNLGQMFAAIAPPTVEPVEPVKETKPRRKKRAKELSEPTDLSSDVPTDKGSDTNKSGST